MHTRGQGSSGVARDAARWQRGVAQGARTGLNRTAYVDSQPQVKVSIGSECSASQMSTADPHVANLSPLYWQSTPRKAFWPTMSATGRASCSTTPCSAGASGIFHTFTVQSAAQEYASSPFDETVMPFTSLVWPVRLRRHLHATDTVTCTSLQIGPDYTRR